MMMMVVDVVGHCVAGQNMVFTKNSRNSNDDHDKNKKINVYPAELLEKVIYLVCIGIKFRYFDYVVVAVIIIIVRSKYLSKVRVQTLKYTAKK